ncbi:MAG: LPS assembly protein LptD [Alphaproteobacteria bacterium]|nr:LPS assembly protein LptD [Alphaproteobacteria bacterium]
MHIVDKYIFRQTLVGFLTILISLTVLIWLTQSLRMIDMIVTKGVSVGTFLEMTLLVLPNFLQILSPLALFGVALFVFIRMQADKELIVLKAVGMNSRQLIRPLLMLGGILVLFGYLLTLWFIPASYSELRQMRWKIQNDLSHLLLQEGQFSSFKNGTTLYIKERESDGKVKGIIAHEIKPDKRSVLIAEEGTMLQTPEGISVTFNSGTRQEFEPKTHQFSVLKFDKYTMLFTDKNGKSTRKLDAREMSLKQLLSATPQSTKDGPTYRKYKVEAFKRLTQPLYNLLFLWMAAFGVLSGFYNRRGQSKQINTVVIAALLVQSFSLAFENIAVRNLWGLLLMAANLFVPLTVLYLVLFKERKIAWIHLVVILLCGTMTLPAQAMPGINIKGVHASKDQPIEFEADNMDYNLKTGILTASGNVVLTQNNIHMSTERILYNKDKDEVTIPQEVKLNLPDGTKSTVNNMLLYPKKSEATANTVSGYLTDGSFIGADRMISTQKGDIIVMHDATYTPCNFCEEKSPLWQIDAKRVTQDFTDHTLSFAHMFLDIKEIPILYFPYFQIPDFTVKRKTGFLPPSFRHNREMNFSIQTPFFVNLADNQNLLFTPVLSFDHTPLGIINYDARFTRGAASLQLSGTQDHNNQNEGHVKANFEYDVTNTVRLKGQYFRTITDTYFRRYDIEGVNDSDSFLQSYLTGEYFGTRLYTRAKFWHFQSLVNKVSAKSIPVVIPTVDATYTTLPIAGTPVTAFTKLNGAAYNNREHFKSNRISATQGLSLPYTFNFGLVTDTQASVRLDGYALDTGNDVLVSKHANDTYNKGRFYTVASTKFSYPLVAQTEETSHILEPIVMLVLSPNTRNPDDIPNIDSAIFDFDDTNLFSSNRYTGYDRIETGSRLNYGFQWTVYKNNAQNRSLSFLFGQVYRFQKNDQLADAMGYQDTHLSDYVGRVQMNYQYLSFAYRFRLNRENLSKQRNDVSLSAGANPFRVGISYLYQGAYQLDNRRYNEENEIRFWANSQLSRNWQASGYYRYNLKKNGGPIEYGIQLRYDNECTALVFDLDKSFARDRNYKGSTSFMVKVFLKTLGGIGE